jgi:hypothetical protein
VSGVASAPSSKRRWRIDGNGSEVVVTIPREFDWIVALVPVFYIPFMYVVFSDKQDPQAVIEIVLLVMVALVMKQWLWNLGGTEILTINHELVSVRYELFGLSWTRRAALTEVEGFNWEKRSYGRNGHPSRIALELRDGFWFFSRIRFAARISQSEAEELIDAIHQRFPGLHNLAHQSSLGLI